MNTAKVAAVRAAEDSLRRAVTDLGSDLAERRIYLEAPGAASAFLKIGDKTVEWPVVYAAGGPK